MWRHAAHGARPAGDGSASESLALGIRYSTAVTTRENVDTPLSSERFVRFCPGSQGGVEWNGPAFHRASGTVFVNAIDWCTSVKLQRLDTLRGTPGEPWTGMDDERLAFGKMDPPSRWKGWITATAGGLVFTGDLDGQALAFDASSGQERRRSAGGAIGGGVITFAAAGKQRIAVAAGLNSPIWPVTGGPARVVVYALP